MRFDKPNCPDCGGLATGTCEHLLATAFIDIDEDGYADYTNYTEIHWDSQETETSKSGRVKLTCSNGHDWWARDTE